MKSKQLFLLYILCSFSSITTNASPYYSIVDLTIQSDRVVIGKLIGKTKNKHVFCVNEIGRQDSYCDTITIANLSKYYTDTTSLNTPNYIGVSQCDEIILYLVKGKGNHWTPVFEGLRLGKNGYTYSPSSYHEDEGFFFFSRQIGSTGWSEMKNRATKVYDRIYKLKKIFNIDKAEKRNETLFKWIDNHKASLTDKCKWGINEDCGWGEFWFKIFERITEGNIARDTWKASTLIWDIYYSNREEPVHYKILYDWGGNSFTTYEAVDTLIDIALDTSNVFYLRRQALIFLSSIPDDYGGVYNRNPRKLDSITIVKRAEERLENRNLLLGLLADDKLEPSALKALKNLYPSIQILPSIKEQYLVEPVSVMKYAYAEYIVLNSSREEWKVFNGSDARIAIELNHIKIDSAQQTLNFLCYRLQLSFNQNSIIYNPPIVVIEDSKGATVYEKEYKSIRLPYPILYGGDGPRRDFKIDISNLEKGHYKVYIKGRAGENNQYYWISGSASFEL